MLGNVLSGTLGSAARPYGRVPRGDLNPRFGLERARYTASRRPPIQRHQPHFANAGALVGPPHPSRSLLVVGIALFGACLRPRITWRRHDRFRFSTRFVRELPDRVSMNTQVLCGDFTATVGLKKQGATVLLRNPLVSLVAGAGFEPATFGL